MLTFIGQAFALLALAGLSVAVWGLIRSLPFPPSPASYSTPFPNLFHK